MECFARKHWIDAYRESTQGSLESLREKFETKTNELLAAATVPDCNNIKSFFRGINWQNNALLEFQDAEIKDTFCPILVEQFFFYRIESIRLRALCEIEFGTLHQELMILGLKAPFFLWADSLVSTNHPPYGHGLSGSNLKSNHSISDVA